MIPADECNPIVAKRTASRKRTVRKRTPKEDVIIAPSGSGRGWFGNRYGSGGGLPPVMTSIKKAVEKVVGPSRPAAKAKASTKAKTASKAKTKDGLTAAQRARLKSGEWFTYGKPIQKKCSSAASRLKTTGTTSAARTLAKCATGIKRNRKK
jgi:hypothetical protein